MKDGNTGNGNTGNGNTGNGNAGDSNAGDNNAGDNNAGHYNAGDNNAGDNNAGHYNAGNGNAGNRNAGNRNAGNRNAGNCNAGHYNTGDNNTGNHNSGVGAINHFCTFTDENRPVFLFNRPAPAGTTLPEIEIKTIEYVHSEQMTGEEKLANPGHAIAGGFLRPIPYKEAWARAWANAGPGTRQAFLSLPNFDPAVFLEITGVDVRQPGSPEAAIGDEIVVNGVRYRKVE